jgi:hypothetical protein
MVIFFEEDIRNVFWVQRFKVLGSGFKVQGSGFRGLRLNGKSLKKVQGSEVQG